MASAPTARKSCIPTTRLPNSNHFPPVFIKIRKNLRFSDIPGQKNEKSDGFYVILDKTAPERLKNDDFLRIFEQLCVFHDFFAEKLLIFSQNSKNWTEFRLSYSKSGILARLGRPGPAFGGVKMADLLFSVPFCTRVAAILRKTGHASRKTNPKRLAPPTGFSNHWKKFIQVFQSLEKTAKKVPMFGKKAQKSSNHWKKCGGIFQALENPGKVCENGQFYSL